MDQSHQASVDCAIFSPKLKLKILLHAYIGVSSLLSDLYKYLISNKNVLLYILNVFYCIYSFSANLNVVYV